MSNSKLRVEEVAIILGCSINTINSWYRFKAKEPDNEYAKLLPEFTREGDKERGMRLWKQADIKKFVEFQKARPIGRNGVMGDITQKYVKKGDKKNG